MMYIDNYTRIIWNIYKHETITNIRLCITAEKTKLLN